MRNPNCTSEFESIYAVKTDLSEYSTDCRLWRSTGTGLQVVLCHIDSDSVFAHFVLGTPMLDDRPLSTAVQRMIGTGSATFGPDFVNRLAREISGAFINATVSPDRTVFTLTADSDAGLVALLPPYLDSIFCPKFEEAAFKRLVFSKEAGDGMLYADAHHSSTAWLANLYDKDSVFSRDVLGTPEKIKMLSLRDVEQYHKNFYRLDNCTVVVGGRVNDLNILEVITSIMYSMLSSAAYPPDKRPSRASEVKAPQLKQPALPPLQPPVRGSRAPVRSTRQAVPMVRFRSVIDDPLQATPSFQGVLVKGSLLGASQSATGSEYDLHIVLQGPDFCCHSRWRAFCLLAQYVARTFNELVLAQSPGGDAGALPVTQDFDVGDAKNVNFSMRHRRWPLAIYSAIGLDSDSVQRTKSRFTEFLKVLADEDHPLCAFHPDNIAILLHSAEQQHDCQFSARGEYDVVTQMSLWSIAVNDIHSQRAKDTFTFCAHPKRDFEYLKAQSTKYWGDLFKKYFGRTPIYYIRESEEGANSNAFPEWEFWSTSAIGIHSDTASFPDLPLLREKQWVEVDKEVDEYLLSIGGRNLI